MNPIDYALAIFAAQVQTAVARTPGQFKRDIEKVESLLKACEKKAKTLNVTQVEQFAKDLSIVAKMFVDGLISMNPAKISLSWLFGNFDPFKPMRFEADRFAATWNLEWSR